MMTDEDRAEIKARMMLEREAFGRACQWSQRACQVGAGDGFLNIMFHDGQMLMMESDAIKTAEGTNEMIDRLIVILSEFFGVDLVQLTLQSFGEGGIQ